MLRPLSHLADFRAMIRLTWSYEIPSSTRTLFLTDVASSGADFDMIPPQSAAIGMVARSTGGGDSILASAVRSEPRTDRFFIRASASGGHGAGLDSFMNGDIIQLNPLATREGFENDAVLTVQAEGFENDALLTASSSPR